MTSMIVEVDGKYLLDRDLGISLLIERDGYVCTYPDCTVPFSDEPDTKYSVTIDHKYPQALAKKEGWTFEQVWALDNLQLMHKICNVRKSDFLYNEDGTLPKRGRTKTPKVNKVPVCETCESGRLLFLGETCEDCGSGPQPSTAPRCLQVPPKECSHGWGANPEYYCWMCFIGLEDRKPTEPPGNAFGDALSGKELEEN